MFKNSKIQCPQCKKAISYQSNWCPYCTSDLKTKEAQADINHQHSKYNPILWVAVGVVALSLFIGLMGSNSHEVVPVSETVTTRKIDPYFNVPSLLGKNVDQIKDVLGTPKDDSEPTELQISLGANEWNKTYEKGGVMLLITYNPKTRKVIDLFLGFHSTDTETILKLGNLSRDNEKYSVKFVEAINDVGYTGVIVKEK